MPLLLKTEMKPLTSYYKENIKVINRKITDAGGGGDPPFTSKKIRPCQRVVTYSSDRLRWILLTTFVEQLVDRSIVPTLKCTLT